MCFAMNAALEALRRETRVLHEALEHTATMRAATLQPEDVTAYGDYLTALAIGVRPLVATLHAAPTEGLRRFLPDADAWACLDADLVALGRDLPPVGPSPPPALSDEEAAWGRLYVVRGAEAGVAMLARQRTKRFTGPLGPTRFSDGLAKRRGEWPHLCDAIGLLTAENATRAAAAARDDFHFVLATLQAWEADANRRVAA